MTSFENRKNKGEVLLNDFIQYLNNNKIPFVHYGYEIIWNTTELRNQLLNYKNTASKLMRFNPDLIIHLKNNCFFCEVKNSSGIEKECFAYYFEIQKIYDIPVYLLLKTKKLYPINSLKFLPMNEFDNIAKMKVPVLDGIWKMPNMLNYEDKIKYVRAYNGKTSGNSFAYINFESPNIEVNVLKKYL